MGRRRCCCGCTECTDCTGCAPEQYQVTLAGLASWPDEYYGVHCKPCEGLDGTYILTKTIAETCVWFGNFPVSYCTNRFGVGSVQSVDIKMEFLTYTDPDRWYVRLFVQGRDNNGNITDAYQYFLLQLEEKPACSLPPDEGEEDLGVPVLGPLGEPLPVPPNQTDCDWRVATLRIKPLTA